MRRISNEPTPSRNLLTYLLQAYSASFEILRPRRTETNSQKRPEGSGRHPFPPEASVQHELHAVQATLS